MAVAAQRISCTGNQWTLIASGAQSVSFCFVQLAAGYVLPTATNTAPVGVPKDLPAFRVDSSAQPHELGDDGSTYWWFWHANTTAIDLNVWKV